MTLTPKPPTHNLTPMDSDPFRALKRPICGLFVAGLRNNSSMNTSVEIEGKSFAILLILTLFAAFLTGCATNKSTLRKAPPTAKDWHFMDSMELVQQFRLRDYSQLLFENVSTNGVKLPPTDENTYPNAITALHRTDSILLSELRKRCHTVPVSDSEMPKGSAPERTLVLRATLVNVDPGSRAARYWLGVGAGKAFVRIKGELVDAKTNAVLLRFEQMRSRSIGVFGGDYDGMLADCIETIGNDICHLIELFNY